MNPWVWFFIGLLLACCSVWLVKLFKYLNHTIYFVMKHREG